MQVEVQGGVGKQSGKGGMAVSAGHIQCYFPPPLHSNPAATHRVVSLDKSPTSDGIVPDSWLLYRYLPAHRRNKGGTRWGEAGTWGCQCKLRCRQGRGSSEEKVEYQGQQRKQMAEAARAIKAAGPARAARMAEATGAVARVTDAAAETRVN